MAKKSNQQIIGELTDSLIEQIEAGTPPWIKPWSTGPMAMPHNGHTGRAYNGINVMLLWAAAADKGYDDSRWVTFRQAKKMGGSVRKGEKSTRIVFWRFFEKEEEEELPNDGGTVTKKKTIPMARVYSVFNVEQCEGLELEALGEAKTYDHDDTTPAAIAHALIKGCGASVTFGGDRAYFAPSRDAVRVPNLERFETAEHFAGTVAHELVHWTGTKERCDREFGKRFGDDAYAFEELVAEMGAAFACASLGIRGKLRHAEYLGHWARIAKADTYALLTASKAAEKAVAFLLDAAGGAEAVLASAEKVTVPKAEGMPEKGAQLDMFAA